MQCEASTLQFTAQGEGTARREASDILARSATLFATPANTSTHPFWKHLWHIYGTCADVLLDFSLKTLKGHVFWLTPFRSCQYSEHDDIYIYVCVCVLNK